MNGLGTKIRDMIARAVIGTADDARGQQALQLDVLDDETLDDVEHFQAYGFTSVPLAEAEAIVVFQGGTRSHGLVIATGDRRFRLRGMERGEVAIHDDQGQVVKLARDGIEIVTDKPLTVTCETATITADQVDLGAAGGPAVARVGDLVDLGTGEIISGSSTVFAA